METDADIGLPEVASKPQKDVSLEGENRKGKGDSNA